MFLAIDIADVCDVADTVKSVFININFLHATCGYVFGGLSDPINLYVYIVLSTP